MSFDSRENGAGRVGIFRLQMFKPSETFIAMQASALQRYAPVHIGRQLFGNAPPGQDFVKFGRGRVADALTMLTASPGQIMRALDGARLDLIHAHFGIDAIYALGLARRLKVPLVTTLHGFDVTTEPVNFLRSAKPALVNYALRQKKLQHNGDLFICVSEFIREKAIARGYPADRTIVHYIGNPSSPGSAAGESAANPDVTIVHVARLVEKKGTRYLIDAIALLRDAGTTCTLWIIGSGPLEASLRAQVLALNLQDRVVFHGTLPHSDVLRLVSRADTLVLPSVTASDGDAEGLGMVLLEAAASGVAIVASRSGGIPEAVVDGKTGLLVEERDVPGLASALRRLLADPAVRREMGRAAQDFVRSRFNLRSQTNSLEDIYDQLKQRGGPVR